MIIFRWTWFIEIILDSESDKFKKLKGTSVGSPQLSFDLKAKNILNIDERFNKEKNVLR